MPGSTHHGALDTLCRCLLLFLLTPLSGLAATLAVEIEGASGELRDNVLAALTIYQEREAGPAPARIRRLHGNAEQEIRAALMPFGYYRPRIQSSLRQQDGAWIARYEIDPGPPLPVTTVDVQLAGDGADDPAFRTLVGNFPIARGDTLNHAQYEEAKDRFEAVAAERGYFDLRFARHEIRVDLAAYDAAIHLRVDTGPRYRFGELIIEQDVLSPELLRRYIRLQPDEPYSTAALLELQRALIDSGYFANVQVDADPQQAEDHTIPVQVQLTPRRPNRYAFGIGYGTDTGVRGQIGWERFYINPRGHHSRVEIRASEIESSVIAGYFIPVRDPRTDQLALTGGYNETETRTAFTRTRRLAISRTHVRGRTYETLSLTHQHEDFDLGTESGRSTLLLPGASWAYYLGADRIYTRLGARALLDLRVASDELASDTSLVQARLQLKAILPVSTFGRFITRLEVGATDVDDFDRLPATLRFFAGGDVSVRGYDYNTLGPTNEQGDVIGGRHLLVGSVEYEQHIAGNWSAAVFYDAGNALNDFGDDLVAGAGIGLRWRSPIGQIRLDAASALDVPDESWRIHLYVGPDL